MLRRTGAILIVLLTVWAALANIAPDEFQIRGRPLSEWLLGPRAIWIALPLIVAWLAFSLLDIHRRLRTLEGGWQNEQAKRKQEYQLWLKDATGNLQRQAAAEYDQLRRDVETLAGANKTALEGFHREYSDRLAEVERTLQEGAGKDQRKWVDPSGASMTFPCVTESGELKHITWDELDELMTRNPEGYYRLRDRNPKVGDWYDRRDES